MRSPVRLANVNGRAVLLTADDQGIDVARASAGKFGPALSQVYDDWAGFCAWAESAPTDTPVVTFERRELELPLARAAAGHRGRPELPGRTQPSPLSVPEQLPPTFTKFVSSLAGPDVEVMLPRDGRADWEVELVDSARPERHPDPRGPGVGVRGPTHRRPGPLRADLPARRAGGPVQPREVLPATSRTVGPWLVTPDEVPDRDDLALGASIDGEVGVQDGRTRDLIFSVPSLISKLSETITLLPGDLVFTGTPAGVGFGRTPKRPFLQPGEELRSWIEGIGEMRQVFVEEQD